MLNYINHMLESKLPEEILTTSDIQMIALWWLKVSKSFKRQPMKVHVESANGWLLPNAKNNSNNV